jgi:hypothetical protein
MGFILEMQLNSKNINNRILKSLHRKNTCQQQTITAAKQFQCLSEGFYILAVPNV